MTAALATVNALVDPNRLMAQARACLDKAYAPYSRFPVAAAVADDRGLIFVGVNVENASYGLTMCAERVAIFSAIASGARRILAVAVTSKNATSLAPCGACRQVMAEFCDRETPIYGDAGTTNPNHWTVASLLPHAFGPSDLGIEKKAP
jgi:homotetrameric cytidine deaminase